ncbi:hypothetical protein ACO2Q3_22645 [Caulobacter sp. KR2-114]|uniref:hypothetical protein n=1 Tax=Caulobacter sp. KR2-114 TaxID=3400912 RepID=UPI003C10CDE0
MNAPDTPAHILRIPFREWFGLTRAEADLLATLYLADGALVASTDLVAAAEIAPGTLAQRVASLRTALDAEGLDTERGGYRLTEGGLAECRAAIWIVGEELRLIGLRRAA